MKTLIFVPTYNEKENVGTLYTCLKKQNVAADILFIDDQSPDGTGELLNSFKAKDPNLFVIHRPMKQGIGSAHRTGITWAYEHGYKCLLTMDSDLTHNPDDIPAMLQLAETADVVVASRYLKKNSLENWSLFRRLLTQLGHLSTMILLGMKQDATGAFRVYRLDKISKTFLDRVRPNGYAFFFESLFVLTRNEYSIKEMPYVLPPRTHGHSKMTFKEVLKSLCRLFNLFGMRIFSPNSILIHNCVS